MSDVAKLHDDEVDIDASLVARLLAEQFPSGPGSRFAWSQHRVLTM